jgi:hypothetical protein
MPWQASVARADDADEARFHDELARQHYEARRFEQALREFFAAARLAPSPRLTFNIAVCFDLLHRPDEAFLYLREYLESEDTDASRRTFAASAMERLTGQVARVSVSSDPPGAEVYVDQRDRGSYGPTPRVLALPPGAHTITLERPGHRPVTVAVEAARGQEITAQGRLEQILGTLRVTGPEGAEIVVREIDGPTLTTARAPAELPLPPGLVGVEVRAEGQRPFTTVSRIGAEATTTLEPALEPLPAPSGDLTVTASASGALVELDGEAAAFAPAVLPSVPAGVHRLRVTHPGLSPWEGEVTVGAGTRGWLTVTLEEPVRTERSDATWVLGGLGLAAAAAGSVLYGLAWDASSQARQAASEMRAAADLTRDGRTYAITGDVLVIGGAAALVTGVILYFATEHTDARESRATYGETER